MAETKSALITGITGQEGSYLTELLLEKGYAVHGLVRRTSNLVRSRIEHLRADHSIYGHRLFLYYGDLSDGTPHATPHFWPGASAGSLSSRWSEPCRLEFRNPESTSEEVAMATLRRLEICRDQPQPVRFYHASASEIFGRAAESRQTEETPLRPVGPYGCAEAFATLLAQAYRQAYGHFGSPTPEKELVLGNTARRDWGHPQDYVAAM